MIPAFLIKESMQKQWHLILPTIIFIVSCCDLDATIYFDRTRDNFEEANPIAAYIWDNYGDSGLIIFKLTATLLSCFYISLILACQKRSLQIATSILGLTVCGFIIGWWILWIFS